MDSSPWLLPAERHFSSEDLDLLSALSNYAAIALENAFLYRSVETKAMELERLKIYTENIIESVNVAILAWMLGPDHFLQPRFRGPLSSQKR